MMNKKRLLESRKAQGLSQRELGERIGLNDAETARTTISKYERGLYAPTENTICKLADVLDIPACYLYIDDKNDFFADQVLKLYRKDMTPLEEELMITKSKLQKCEKTLEFMSEMINTAISQLKKGE
ncbi:helix-turn-helix domain-containing protein [Xenorhabdus sp. KK7.4]|uniref:helix-turn-helix domain-containing protein n=1 Tax=Xenorhabdus sp. KK7.4 TaxID=1851572 RepID=UPI000C042DDA|nr:helix-turn-helix transcriptional regulator [Xenorhabdus sp. KK7.4]PHM51275.1 transcriptional regulator [Xenorhabdus sp. KK7.4]